MSPHSYVHNHTIGNNYFPSGITNPITIQRHLAVNLHINVAKPPQGTLLIGDTNRRLTSREVREQ